MNTTTKPPCVGLTHIFFDAYRTHKALTICNTCPTLQECRTRILNDEATQDRYHIQGVAGGLTAKQRTTIWRTNRPPVRYSTAECHTDAGYRRHLRNGETPCPDCKQAHNEHKKHKARTARTRVAS
jgi:hypothetical protein